jgi:hypothetical protein
MAGHVARLVEKGNACRLLLRNPEGKRSLRKRRRRWTDNSKMDLGEVGWVGVGWIGLVQERDKWGALLNGLMNLRVPQTVGKLSSGYTTCDLSSSNQFHRVNWL